MAYQHPQRNKNIIQAYLQGTRQVDLAKKYKLSRQRIYAIIRTYISGQKPFSISSDQPKGITKSITLANPVK